MTTDTETDATAAREVSPWTHRIDATQLAATRDKVDAINRRAAKRALGGRLTLDVQEVEETEIDPHTGISATRILYDVAIGGTAPAYNGWQFIAVLGWDEHAGLIVRAVPGAAQVERERLREGWCDHCRTVRARRVTYVVRNAETGRQLQVGRTCIKDFTGWAGTVAFLDAPTGEDGEQWFGPTGEPVYSPLTVLAYAWAVIKLYGWTPASMVGWHATPTREHVLTALYPAPRSERDREFARTLAPLAEEATAKAREILAFILSDDFSGTSDYVLNLRAVAAGKAVSVTSIGLLVSALQAYARHQERTLRRQHMAALAANSEFFGEIKKRYELSVTVAGVRYLEGEWGTTTLYTLVDDDGNLLKWFASRDVLGDDEGARFTIKATVKKHEVYEGTKQTMLTRCAVVEQLPQLPEAEPAPAASGEGVSNTTQ